MKKTLFITITAIFLSISILPAAKQIKDKSFKGRVIFVSNDYIEVKRGRAELIVHFTDKTIFVAKDGSEKNKEIIEICQVVKALYNKEQNKNILSKVIVLKESDCIK